MRSSPARWFISLRPYSFTASLMPVLLALVISMRRDEDVLWWTVPVFTLAAVLFQSATNVLNDFYDHLHGVDGPDDRDPTHAISRGIVTPRFMLLTGHLYFVLALILGTAIAVLARRGAFFLLGGLGGALGAYLYTGKRFSFKYVALGDLLVFLLMGPVLVFLGVRAFTGTYQLEAILLSLPPALLVTAILHGNNLRDLDTDRAAGVRTLAGIIGWTGSRRFFGALVLGAYGVLVLLFTAGLIPLTAFLPALSLPGAFRLFRTVGGRAEKGGNALVNLPRRTAELHFLFSLLYATGIAAGTLL